MWFAYSADRKGEHPHRHLKELIGILQADGYAGFERLYNDQDPQHPIKEPACWAHVRRKFYDIYLATDSSIASEALTRIAELYAISADNRPRLGNRSARHAPSLSSPNCIKAHRHSKENSEEVRSRWRHPLRAGTLECAHPAGSLLPGCVREPNEVLLQGLHLVTGY